jgi:hypothetical protein
MTATVIEKRLRDLGGDGARYSTAELCHGEGPLGSPNIGSMDQDWHSVAVFVADLHGVRIIARVGRGMRLPRHDAAGAPLGDTAVAGAGTGSVFTVGVAAIPTHGGRIRRGAVWTLDAIIAGTLISACRAFEEATEGRCYTAHARRERWFDTSGR